MDLDTLYKQYGSLMINLEIIQGKIQECKRHIVQTMNLPRPEKREVKEPIKKGDKD